uniref:non-specific serine/threonine protein kinase n=1 Tax=Nelumbo nucifera TaxID=4432 RepID=A0A822ZRP4_NELNU|nr:TPA_asm: hypothetical protein HUJ06_004249 [Nelumbo nucifera]
MLSSIVLVLSLIIIIVTITSLSALAIDFLFNSFTNYDLLYAGDARAESGVIRFTDDSVKFSFGRAFYPEPIPMVTGTTSISSFSTSFVFNILPSSNSSPSFGLAFVLSNSTFPAGALPGQFFGLFSNANVQSPFPLLVIEFDTGQNPEFNDPDGNHVGINFNNIESVKTETAGCYDSAGGFVPIDMRSGQNIRAWVEFDGAGFQINVTIAPASISRPSKPLITFRDPKIANYLFSNMLAGFSSSTVTWVEAQRILAWSLSDTGVARDINITDLPTSFSPLPASAPEPAPASMTLRFRVGVTATAVVSAILCSCGLFWFRYRMKRVEHDQEQDESEEWEFEYWSHRYSYEDLYKATNGFSKDELLGHDSKQRMREFMAEISSMGRLQHKSLVHMRGWCRKDRELMLVYDCMPNGSLNHWIFDQPKALLGWEGRRRVLVDIAEGLSYLHHGWDQLVLHRDIKPSNVLLDSEMRGRLGDFGLAKLYQHGRAPITTRLVGTVGYMAPELVKVGATTASDVYNFGVMQPLLVDWVRKLHSEGKLCEAADARMTGEYEVEDMEVVLKLGLACCHPEPHRRLTMKEVVVVLTSDEPQSGMVSLLSELAYGYSSDDGGGLVAGDDKGSLSLSLSLLLPR